MNRRFLRYFALSLLLLCGTASALGLQELLDRHAKAMGGRDKIAALKSLEIESELSIGGMTGHSTSYHKAPDRLRVDLSLPIMQSTQVCNGNDCWMSDNSGLVHTLTAELKRMLVTQMVLERDLYLDSASFPGTITLAPETTNMDGVECYQIDLVPQGGVPAALFIGKDDYLVHQVNMTTDLAKMQSKLSDYREVSGIMIPFHAVERTDAGIIAGDITVTKVEVNPDLPDSLFEHPGAAGSVEQGAMPDSIVVPFEIHNNHIYISLQISGTGPFQFIFDSGAGGMAISDKLPAELGLESLGRAEARGVGGADSAQVYSLDQVQLGALSLDSLAAFALDLSSLEKMLEQPLSGIIGYDLLSRYIITVDYYNKQLTIYPRSAKPRDWWGDQCDLTLDFRLPYMTLTVNDSISGRFRIDTGSRSTLDLNSPFIMSHNLIDTTQQRYLRYDLYGLGGSSSGIVSLLPSLEVCGTRLDSLYVGYSLSTEGLFAGNSTAGNLGSGILKRFVVTFDYNHEEVYFRKSPDAAKLGRIRNMAGVLVAKDGDSLRISEVFAAGPAAGKLEVGDRLLRIDGVPVTGRSIDEVNWMMIDLQGRKLKIEFERNGVQLSDSVALQSLY